MTKILLLLFEDMPMLHISMQNWIQLRSLLILDLSLNLVSIFEPLLNGGLLQASSIFSDYLCFSGFWSNLKQREHIFPPPGVFDFQFSDNICYLALQRPYLNLQVCIVIHFILMFEWHYSAAFFFFFLINQDIQVIAPSSPSSFLSYQSSEPPVPLHDWRIFSHKSTWLNWFLICT